MIETEDGHLKILRRRCGKGFRYLDAKGKAVTSTRQLRRIRALVIPPMWDEVRISVRPDTHLQALGRDQKGRRQYIYHEQWQLQQQQKKFERLTEFARRLPHIRKHCRTMIRKRTWTREKVLALMIFILDDTGIRIGNRFYQEENGSYGLSTLRRKHLKLSGRTVEFDFIGKSGKRHQVDIDDTGLSALIRRSAGQPGHRLFRYQAEDGHWSDVDSDDVNDFIRQEMGPEFSCKDFRTWVATRLAVGFYPAALDNIGELSEDSGKACLKEVLEGVASELGNTVAVCREHYIHPAVLAGIKNCSLPVVRSRKTARKSVIQRSHLSRVERATLDVLEANTGKRVT